jgi:hypothetical protein
MTAELRFQTFLDTRDILPPAVLLEYFDSLAPVAIEFMFGDWDGGVFATGHDGEQQMSLVHWVGKTFHSRDDVDPIIVRRPGEERTASPIMGKATLRMVEFRGQSTATMIYDKHPILDHFRKITDDLVMGVMDRKGEAAPLFFYLRRARNRSQPSSQPHAHTPSKPAERAR